MQRRYTILVLYYAPSYPLRAAIHDHLYSFQKYSNHRVVYLNAAVRSVPEYFFRIPFDLVIFHTIALGRWYRESFWQVLGPLRVLKQISATKVILPQDEFLGSETLLEFIREFGIDCVFSVSPPSEWPKIYDGADFDRVKFSKVLTGYLDDETVATINRLAETTATRDIDVGYRAYRAEAWLGRFGYLKGQLADRFADAAPRHGLTTDISTAPRDTFLGLDWYRFLLRCKYTIGVEGGSSILDRTGTIKKCTEEYLQAHPQASFEDVEQACFLGLDGSLRLEAISPRHLEACATRTCQILMAGHYDGVLRPGEHYLELQRDFSNLDEVLERVRRDDVRRAMTQRAYDDVVASQQYTYRRFVQHVVDTSLEGRPAAAPPAAADALFQRAVRDDARSWRKIRFAAAIGRPLLTRLGPLRRLAGSLRRWVRRRSI